MNIIKTKRYKATGKECNTVEAMLFYDIGGPNFAYGGVTKRGYYLSVTPKDISSKDGYTTESFTAFTGTKWLINPVSRHSKKAADHADMFVQKCIKNAVDYVCKDQQVELMEGVTW